MTPSMGHQALTEKKRRARDEVVRTKRVRAVGGLRTGDNVSDAVRISAVSRATCDRFRAALDFSSTDETAL